MESDVATTLSAWSRRRLYGESAKQHRIDYLDFLARCEQAFRPFAPIELPDFFRGRSEEVEILVRELRTSGRQVAIYGERGVGKTSLARLADFFARFGDEATYFVRCDQSSNYESIFGELLWEAGLEYLPNGQETTSGPGTAAKLGPLSGSGQRGKRVRERPAPSASRIGPSMLLRRFKDEEGLLIIDEYDRVRDEQTHTRLAETLKHFSDAASKTKIIVVGVAETLSELVGQHASLTRCTAQLKLERMSAEELEEIIAGGEKRVGMVFHAAVRRRIACLSDGFPFYTHLLCKYTADESARVLLDDPGAKVVGGEREYEKAIRTAARTGDATLRDAYQRAVITTKRKTDMFRHVLWAVAYADTVEVQVRSIAENMGILTGKRPSIESLANYLGPLVREDKGGILSRVRQGYYKFSDPLMRAYVRLLMEDHNIETSGQFQFPWMLEGR